MPTDAEREQVYLKHFAQIGKLPQPQPQSNELGEVLPQAVISDEQKQLEECEAEAAVQDEAALMAYEAAASAAILGRGENEVEPPAIQGRIEGQVAGVREPTIWVRLP